LRKDAEARAKKTSILLETYFIGHNVASQVKQVRECIDGNARPNTVIVLPVRDHGFGFTVRASLRAGISFVYTDRTEDDLIGPRRTPRTAPSQARSAPTR
jgi:hypothetical protein